MSNILNVPVLPPLPSWVLHRLCSGSGPSPSGRRKVLPCHPRCCSHILYFLCYESYWVWSTWTEVRYYICVWLCVNVYDCLENNSNNNVNDDNNLKIITYMYIYVQVFPSYGSGLCRSIAVSVRRQSASSICTDAEGE